MTNHLEYIPSITDIQTLKYMIKCFDKWNNYVFKEFKNIKSFYHSYDIYKELYNENLVIKEFLKDWDFIERNSREWCPLNRKILIPIKTYKIIQNIVNDHKQFYNDFKFMCY